MSYNLQRTCLKFSSLCLFLLFFQFCLAQGKRKNDKEYGLDRFPGFDAWLSSSQKSLGGEFVGIVATDTVVFKKEMGEFNAKTEAPLGATSSWLTAALIMILVDEGKIDLDDKITQYLPMYEKYGKNYITIRHCLTHYTGIEQDPKAWWEMKKAGSLVEAAEAFAKREIKTNPGTESGFSNIGPIIAGAIAEIVMKKKFDQLIKSKLFNPAGMSKTTFSTLDGTPSNPAGGARSTANDLVRFLQLLLNNGKINNRQILSEAAVKELRTLTSQTGAIKNAPKMTTNWGYAVGSWAVEERNGQAISLAAPALYGTLPIVDWCRGYAAVLVTKAIVDEPKNNQPNYMAMKEAIDESVNKRCN